MEMNLSNTKIKNNSIELFCFLFSMVYLGEIAGTDIRIAIYFFWAIYSLFRRSHRNIYFYRKQLKVVLFLTLILVYSSLVFLFTASGDTFFILRIMRCLISTVVVYLFFSDTDTPYTEISKAFIRATGIQSLAVISGMLFPQIKIFLQIFNGYAKKDLPFRSSGLFSGYDFAGYFINVAILLLGLLLIWKKEKNSFSKYLYFLFLIFSLILTSRFNVVVLVINSLILLFASFRNNNFKAKNFFVFINAILGIFLLLFSVISMNIAPEVKYYIITKYPALYSISENLSDSYANYDVATTISNQFFFPKGSKIIFGFNERAPVDPGYVNNIYYVGIVGLIMIISLYIYLVVSNTKKNWKEMNIFLLLLLILNLIFEIKLSFLLSSSAFELMMIFCCAKGEKQDEYPKNKERTDK